MQAKARKKKGVGRGKKGKEREEGKREKRGKEDLGKISLAKNPPYVFDKNEVATRIAGTQGRPRRPRKYPRFKEPLKY